MSAIQDFMERARRLRQMGDPTIVVLPVRGDDAVRIIGHIEALEANEVTLHERIRNILDKAAEKFTCDECGSQKWFSEYDDGVEAWNEDGTPHGH